MRAGMYAELPMYAKLAADFTLPHAANPGNKAFMHEFTTAILAFWAANKSKIPTWTMAAQMTFAVQPNSVECERVLSMLTRMYGQHRHRSLADEISAALMLAYNKRSVG